MWVNEVKMYLPDIPIIIAANKVDKITERNESIIKEANKYAKKLNLTHFEVSARSGKNVKELFYDLAS
jgi:GTPase SAR1 family protein